MNREIEFRGLNNNKKWIFGDLVQAKDKNRCAILPQKEDEFDYNVFEVDINSVGQFTGLTDKNGVKIFEGDVLEFVGKVYYADACFFTDNAIPLAFSEKHRVVIGNIYENKNLIS